MARNSADGLLTLPDGSGRDPIPVQKGPIAVSTGFLEQGRRVFPVDDRDILAALAFDYAEEFSGEQVVLAIQMTLDPRHFLGKAPGRKQP